MSLTGIRAGLQESIVDHQEWPSVRNRVKEHLRDKDLDYQDAIGQMFGNRWDDVEMAAFASIRAWIVAGEVLVWRIPLGSLPGGDAEREWNAKCVTRLPLPYRATVDLDQNMSDLGDGSLWWDSPLEMSDGDFTYAIPVSDGSLPLEIGYSRATTTYGHLSRFGSVARWPYQSEDVFVLWMLPHVQQAWLDRIGVDL